MAKIKGTGVNEIRREKKGIPNKPKEEEKNKCTVSGQFRKSLATSKICKKCQKIRSGRRKK